jgi:hypothetical protein
VKSTRSSNKITLNENETETTCLDKANESIEDIGCTFNHLLKNPPLYACPFNDFKDIHNLPCEGINPHRLRTGKDVLETKMIQVFGLAKALGILL